MTEKKPTQTPLENVLSKWLEEQDKRLEKSRAEVARLLSTRPEIAIFEVQYSGSGDDGSIEELTASDNNNNPVPLQDDFNDAVEDLVYDLLAVHCSGWEIDAGSSGRITINAKTLQGTIEHGWVVTHTESHEIEF
jgi:hypothetical protein